ncbi:MAG: hypothetical protein JWP74_719 [Marmoricola sp.]|nr:hypothetical protein [Marmoricola sp.]
MSLPRSASLTLWLGATLRGLLGPDDFAEAVRGEDPQHLVVGLPGSPDQLPLASFPAAVQRLGTTTVTLALPAPGDPLGLGGPAVFNGIATDTGEAVLLGTAGGSFGLVPELDARTVVWTVHPAVATAPTDPVEAGRTLRQVLQRVTAELVRLDVTGWQPEIPDLLLNLRHRPALALPAGSAPEHVDTLERAALCAEIVELALADDGGAVTAHEMAARRACLTELDHAARRALVAVCSASLGLT